jgi:hypothetical protein
MEALGVGTTSEATAPGPDSPGGEIHEPPEQEGEAAATDERMDAAGGAGASEEEAPPAEVEAPEGQAGEIANANEPTDDAAQPEGADTSAEEDETQGDPAGAPGTPEGGAALPPEQREAALGALGEPVGPGSEEDTGGGAAPAAQAIPDHPEPHVPDVSSHDPSEALATVGGLPPSQLAQGLTAVAAAAQGLVGHHRDQLAEEPPQIERPAGAPATQDAPADASAPPPVEGERSVATEPEGAAVPTPAPEPLPRPPPAPTEHVAIPAVTGNAQGNVSAEEAQELQHSIAALPTTDPGLAVGAGPAPVVALEGNADPEQARAQRAHLDQAMAAQAVAGRSDAMLPLGEHRIYPHVPREILRAEIPRRPEPRASGPAAAAGPTDATEGAASILAQQERGAEIRSAVSQAQGEMAQRRQEHAQQASAERARSQQEVAALQAQSAADQTRERHATQGEAARMRGEWTDAQDAAAQRARGDADRADRRMEQDVAREQTQADRQAAEHIAQGNSDARDERHRAEERAAGERRRAQESSGFFGQIASGAQAFFADLRSGIRAIFDAARRAVRDVIQRAQRLATEVIERARQVIVAAIRVAGAALIAIGNVYLAAFPALRDRFRRAIQDRVRRAEATVNALADRLRTNVLAALRFLGRALDAALGLLERGLLAAVRAANRVVQGAIRWARSTVQAFGLWADLIRDVAADPRHWLRNLGAAVVDGLRNHLWRAFKHAVQRWFHQKVEEVLGLGLTIWNLLRHGGISLAQIARMAWEAIKAAIPGVLIQLLIEKLVSMLIPAAGAVMAIIEGLRAAWGAAQRVLVAFQRFFAFLRAVKTGHGGPAFARAVAAAGIAVIEFVAQWLLRRLRRPAGAVAGRIRAIAQRIGAALRRVGQRVLGAVRRAARWVGRRLGRVGRRVEAWVNRQRRRISNWWARRRGRQPLTPQQRLDRAVERIRPSIARLLARGASDLRLRAQLLFYRLRYGLRSLRIERGGGGSFSIVAQVNPATVLINGVELDRNELLAHLRTVSREVLQHPDVVAGGQQILGRREQGEGPTPVYTVSQAEPLPAVVLASRGMPMGRRPGTAEQIAFEGATAEGVYRQQRGRRGREVASDAALSNKLVFDVVAGHPRRAGGAYADLADRLEQMSASRSRAEVSLAMTSWIRTRQFPGGTGAFSDAERATLVQAAVLMTVQESHRSPTSLATAPMALNLAGRGTRWSEALAAFPMSPRGAASRARALDRFLDQEALAAAGQGRRPRGGARIERQAEAEIALLMAWIRLHQLDFGDASGRDATMRRIKEYIRRMVFSFYGLAPRPSPPALSG